MYDGDVTMKNNYIWAYTKCFNLVKNAQDKKKINMDFLPTDNVFGKYNIHKSNIDSSIKYLDSIGDIKNSKIRLRPYKITPTLAKKCIIDEKVKKFNIKATPSGGRPINGRSQ